MEYLTLFPLKRALLLSDVDIILRTLPLQLNLRQFAFVMIVSSCRRVGLKTVPATEQQLSRLFSRYPLLPPSLPPSLPPCSHCHTLGLDRFLEVLNEYSNQRDLFGVLAVSADQTSALSSTRSMMIPNITAVSSSDHLLESLIFFTGRRNQREGFEAPGERRPRPLWNLCSLFS
jgi:hypothetical protein